VPRIATWRGEFYWIETDQSRSRGPFDTIEDAERHLDANCRL